MTKLVIQEFMKLLPTYSNRDLEVLRLDVIFAKKGEVTRTNEPLFELTLQALRDLHLAINDEQDRRMEQEP